MQNTGTTNITLGGLKFMFFNNFQKRIKKKQGKNAPISVLY